MAYDHQHIASSNACRSVRAEDPERISSDEGMFKINATRCACEIGCFQISYPRRRTLETVFRSQIIRHVGHSHALRLQLILFAAHSGVPVDDVILSNGFEELRACIVRTK